MAKLNVIEKDKYYQGILQLRNCSEEVLDFVHDAIENEKGVKIAITSRQKDGIDLYLTSNKFLKKIGKILNANFPGVLKMTSKLHTEDVQSGRKIYRGTVFFKMPKFKVGDEGVFRGDEVRVLSIGPKIMLQDTKTGKKKRVIFEEVEKHFRI